MITTGWAPAFIFGKPTRLAAWHGLENSNNMAKES